MLNYMSRSAAFCVLLGQLLPGSVEAAESQVKAPVKGQFEPEALAFESEFDVGVFAGLSQPLVLGGGNLQFELIYGRFVFDYSHGFSLELPASGAAAEQGLAIHLPFSTGLGLGYRFTRSFDLRFEPKWHQFSIRQGGDPSAQQVARYQTVTLGVGAYYSYRPFRESTGFSRGFTLQGSIRAWPNVWSSLANGEVGYENTTTGRRERHEVANIGIANTPMLVNLGIGYHFGL